MAWLPDDVMLMVVAAVGTEWHVPLLFVCRSWCRIVLEVYRRHRQRTREWKPPLSHMPAYPTFNCNKALAYPRLVEWFMQFPQARPHARTALAYNADNLMHLDHGLSYGTYAIHLPKLNDAFFRHMDRNKSFCQMVCDQIVRALKHGFPIPEWKRLLRYLRGHTIVTDLLQLRYNPLGGLPSRRIVLSQSVELLCTIANQRGDPERRAVHEFLLVSISEAVVYLRLNLYGAYLCCAPTKAILWEKCLAHVSALDNPSIERVLCDLHAQYSTDLTSPITQLAHKCALANVAGQFARMHAIYTGNLELFERHMAIAVNPVRYITLPCGFTLEQCMYICERYPNLTVRITARATSNHDAMLFLADRFPHTSIDTAPSAFHVFNNRELVPIAISRTLYLDLRCTPEYSRVIPLLKDTTAGAGYGRTAFVRQCIQDALRRGNTAALVSLLAQGRKHLGSKFKEMKFDTLALASPRAAELLAADTTVLVSRYVIRDLLDSRNMELLAYFVQRAKDIWLKGDEDPLYHVTYPFVGNLWMYTLMYIFPREALWLTQQPVWPPEDIASARLVARKCVALTAGNPRI